MAKYIEFVGVPGVGKSTTYEFLKTSYVKTSNWIPYEELCKNKYKYRKGIKEFLISFLINKIRPNALSKKGHDRIVLNKAIKKNPELIELFWQTIFKCENINGEELRFYGVNYIRAILEKIQNIKEETSDKYCIVDEGLIHNINYFIPDTSASQIELQVSKILSLMDLPNAIIYFYGDASTIVKRTIERGSLRLRDKFLTPEELLKSRRKSIKEKSIYIDAVKSRNIPVLSLDTNDSLKNNSSRIISFINGLG